MNRGPASFHRITAGLIGLICLVVGVGAQVTAMHPDKADDLANPLAGYAKPEQLLQCVEAVLACREALDMNVKPKFAVDAMVATIGQVMRPS